MKEASTKPATEPQTPDRRPRSRAFRLMQAAFLLFLIVATIVIIRGHNKPTLLTAQGGIYGTYYKIQYVHTEPLDTLILNELKAVDKSLSMFNSGSTIARINSGETTETDEMLREVFKLSESVSAETGGAYDVTVAPLVNAWGFGFKSGEMPTDSQVDSLLAFVGIGKVKLDGTQMLKSDPRTMLDFSSIAKGYAVDCVAKALKDQGVKDFMVEIGGEVVVSGKHPENRPWRIGVGKPTDDSEEIQIQLELTDAAMATSGNYRRFYEKDGRRYAHTIDPKSGRPVQHELLSATVLASDCATADAYATAFMVLGLAKSKEVLQRHPELSAYLIYTAADGSYATWQTENLKEYIAQP